MNFFSINQKSPEKPFLKDQNVNSFLFAKKKSNHRFEQKIITKCLYSPSGNEMRRSGLDSKELACIMIFISQSYVHFFVTFCDEELKRISFDKPDKLKINHNP
jgi:hypothetical protein